MKYFTDRLEEALREEGVLERALEYASKNMSPDEEPEDGIAGAFLWEETAEGFYFWSEVDTKTNY